MARKGISCKRVRTKAHAKMICRSTRTGRIVSGGSAKRKSRLVCPKRAFGYRVHRAKNGSCYIKTKAGGQRFVKKVHSRRRRRRKAA